jgi:hypothetical protein
LEDHSVISFASHSLKADLAEFSPEVLNGLNQLARAVDYAWDLDSPLWDFAVEIDRLLALGMTTSDLRWLVKRGYASHAREMTTPQDTERRFDAAEQNLAFAKNTCFMLTDAGLAILGRAAIHDRDHTQPDGVVVNNMLAAVGADQAEPLSDAETVPPSRPSSFPHSRPAMMPSWDSESRTFLVGKHVIKRFRVPSRNQEAVLDAFQEEGWPLSIDDPLSPVPDQHPKRRLRDTIKGLNTNQVMELIRFRGDGTGDGRARRLGTAARRFWR